MLAGRFVWLLGEMCRKQGIDVQEIDENLDFWENKSKIEEKARGSLVLKLSRLDELEEDGLRIGCNRGNR